MSQTTAPRDAEDVEGHDVESRVDLIHERLQRRTPPACWALCSRYPAEDRDLPLDTARTWLAESGSTSAAAASLFLHRNTVRYRLRRLEELTGLG